MTLMERLKAIADEDYAHFQAKLTPGIPEENFIGVRVPVLRKFAGEYTKEAEHHEFMKTLPHQYYDENMLQGLLIERIKDYQECVEQVDRFLPYVDNWAVCDTMSPKVFKKHKVELLDKIREWSSSDRLYTARFAIGMLMKHYLEEDFQEEFLEIPASIKTDEYYMNMMIAWFFATALAKQWEATIPYIEKQRLDKWTHNKAIQKSLESNRIADEKKNYLRGLKIR